LVDITVLFSVLFESDPRLWLTCAET